MTNPEPPSGGVEFPPLENSTPPMDPYAPVDYPTNYPGSGYDSFPSASYPPSYPPSYPGAPGYPPPYPGYDPYDPYRYGKPPGTNGKAIAALITAIGGLLLCGLPSIAGIVLGLIAMRETKRTGQDGYGLALAGLIVGCLVVALGIFYVLFIIVIAASSSSYGTY